MKITDSNVIRFHLQVTYGIYVKSLTKKKERLLITGTKVFGVPLENLHRQYIPEFGLVPCFLVNACAFLLERAGTVGLFRKPGSLPRIKALRAKLNRGEGCLTAPFPYDVSTLIKQFCRELPEPLFPSELHPALLKAQALSSPRDRTSALQLLSCLLPARNASCLHYLLDFLFKVSQRTPHTLLYSGAHCIGPNAFPLQDYLKPLDIVPQIPQGSSENLMSTSNIATVFAPCLLPPPNKAEMSEMRLELRVLVLRTFIESPHLFGVIPKTVMDSMDFLINFHPLKDPKRGHGKRPSLKEAWSTKTLPWSQGRSKESPPASEGSRESTSVDRVPLRRSLGLETFPNVLLFRTCVPCAEQGFRPAAALLESPSPVGKETCETPRRPARDLCLGNFLRFTSGQDAGPSPVTGVAKRQLTPWRRRISL